MSAVLPVRGERWRFRHLPAPRGMVAIRRVDGNRVTYVYVATGAEQETDLTWFLRTYELVHAAPLALVKGVES